MSSHAVNPAALPRLSSRLVRRANPSSQTCNGGGELRASCGGHANSNWAAMGVNFYRQGTDENFAPVWVSRSVSRPLLGHCFGAIPAPCGTASFCFGCAALSGSRFLPEQVCKRGQERRTNFFRAPPRKHSLALGSRAHSLGFAMCDPSRIREINETETPPCIRTK
jgi:hypothetical protein